MAEIDPVKHVHVVWLFGATSLEEKHKAHIHCFD